MTTEPPLPLPLRATVQEALQAWETKGPTSLTVALLADALYRVQASEHTEWAVEVTWRDWRKAGAKGPTSQFGPFSTQEQRDSFLEMQRRDRDITATRVLERRAAYTDWTGPDTPTQTSEEEREALLNAYYESMMKRRTDER